MLLIKKICPYNSFLLLYVSSFVGEDRKDKWYKIQYVLGLPVPFTETKLGCVSENSALHLISETPQKVLEKYVK